GLAAGTRFPSTGTDRAWRAVGGRLSALPGRVRAVRVPRWGLARPHLSRARPVRFPLSGSPGRPQPAAGDALAVPLRVAALDHRGRPVERARPRPDGRVRRARGGAVSWLLCRLYSGRGERVLDSDDDGLGPMVALHLVFVFLRVLRGFLAGFLELRRAVNPSCHAAASQAERLAQAAKEDRTMNRSRAGGVSLLVALIMAGYALFSYFGSQQVN